MVYVNVCMCIVPSSSLSKLPEYKTKGGQPFVSHPLLKLMDITLVFHIGGH